MITSIHRYGEWGIVALCAGVYLLYPSQPGYGNTEEHRRTITSQKDRHVSLSWIQRPGDFSSVCSFFLTWVSANTIVQGDRSAVSPLVKEAYRKGIPGILDEIVFVEI